jgi:hypothetical protein
VVDQGGESAIRTLINAAEASSFLASPLCLQEFSRRYAWRNKRRWQYEVKLFPAFTAKARRIGNAESEPVIVHAVPRAFDHRSTDVYSDAIFDDR